jgi:hypothetical protein
MQAIRNRAQRAAQVVSEHPQEKIARLVHLDQEDLQRLGDGLVDRLVEANDIVQVLDPHAGGGSAPQAQDGRTQRSILSNHLFNGKSLSLSLSSMAARRQALACRSTGALTFRLRLSLIIILRPAHIGSNFLEDELSVVQQRALIHASCCRQLITGKGDPVRQDRLEVGTDEI